MTGGAPASLTLNLLNIPLLRTASGQRSSECRATNELQTALKLSEPPFFLRDSRACDAPFLAWGDFHVRSRFARSTIPEEKWGTTRSLLSHKNDGDSYRKVRIKAEGDHSGRGLNWKCCPKVAEHRQHYSDPLRYLFYFLLFISPLISFLQWLKIATHV